MPSPPRYSVWKPLLLIAVVVASAIVAQRAGWLDREQILFWARGYSGRWWMPAALITLQAGLFTFALPGSIVVVIAGLLYSPWPGTALVVCGSTLGALAAYSFARTLGGDWVARFRTNRLYRFLSRRHDLPTLTALRTLPGFPHWVISYTASLVGIPLGKFLLATAIGHSVKGFLYVSAIYNAAAADSIEEAISWKLFAPLLGLAGLILLAAWARARWRLGQPEDAAG